MLMESIRIVSLGAEDKAGDERISDYGVQREKIVLYSLTTSESISSLEVPRGNPKVTAEDCCKYS